MHPKSHQLSSYVLFSIQLFSVLGFFDWFWNRLFIYSSIVCLYLRLGSAMASRLLSAGYTLTLFARTPSKSLYLESQGARLANSLSDLAKASDVIFTMVGHPSDVRQIVLQNSTGLIPHLNPNTVIIDHTSHPLLAKEIYDAAREKNCYSVDAPVSDGDIGARDGKLAIFAGYLTKLERNS